MCVTCCTIFVTSSYKSVNKPAFPNVVTVCKRFIASFLRTNLQTFVCSYLTNVSPAFSYIYNNNVCNDNTHNNSSSSNNNSMFVCTYIAIISSPQTCCPQQLTVIRCLSCHLFDDMRKWLATIAVANMCCYK